MKNQNQSKQKNIELLRPGNPNRTEQQHNPSRLDPQKQQNQRHLDKLSKQKKHK